jgi:hypothetical protein
MTNAAVADVFIEVAGLLEHQGASPHRVRAWRDGAAAVRAEPRPVEDIFRDEGLQGLDAIPHIGAGLAATIVELVRSGRCRALERLHGEIAPCDVFADLPGIGHELGERIHHELGIDTLAELERAAHDGRLATVEGFGDRRVQAVREILAGRLTRPARDRAHAPPPVALLLDVERRYRDLDAAGKLRRIAPKRENPDGAAWLPILHEERGGWRFTVVYSNTPLAHKLGKTHDWVVVYYEREGDEGRATVVTETHGPLAGQRVVRGREREGGRPAID